jgi:dolichol-phosphate mannosyltransferase
MQSKQLSPANATFWPTLKRFLQFGLVGATGVLVDMAILFLLADPRMLGWGLSLSKSVAAETAIVNNFLWNDLWTFRDLAAGQANWRGRLQRFGKFNLICLAGIGLNVVLLNAQVRLLQMNLYAANLTAILLVSLWNFWMNLKFGWSKPAGV